MNIDNEKIIYLIRKLINEDFDLESSVLNEGVAHEEISSHLKNNRVKQLMHRSTRGVPFYSYGATRQMLKNYINKQEKNFIDVLKPIFSDEVKIEHIKNEISIYLSNKPLLTINLEPNRLKSSYIRFDFMKPKEKDKIRINISPEEIRDIIQKHRKKFEDYGLEHLLK